MEENCTLKDYYKVLQCDRCATADEIKKSYQRLALTLHPDKTNGDVSEKEFLLIQKAWSVLRNPESRKQYDAELSCQEHNVKNQPSSSLESHTWESLLSPYFEFILFA